MMIKWFSCAAGAWEWIPQGVPQAGPRNPQWRQRLQQNCNRGMPSETSCLGLLSAAARESSRGHWCGRALDSSHTRQSESPPASISRITCNTLTNAVPIARSWEMRGSSASSLLTASGGVQLNFSRPRSQTSCQSRNTLAISPVEAGRVTSNNLPRTAPHWAPVPTHGIGVKARNALEVVKLPQQKKKVVICSANLSSHPPSTSSGDSLLLQTAGGTHCRQPLPNHPRWTSTRLQPAIAAIWAHPGNHHGIING